MPKATEIESKAEPASVRGALVVAAVIAEVIEHVVPFGHYLLYPFTLLATWVHEMGHGLTALALGGTFARLDVFRDGSGLAHCTFAHGLPQALVAMGGLLAPPFVGAAVLGLGRGPRRTRIILLALAAALVISLAVWVRTVAGWVAMPLVAALVAAFGLWGSPKERLVFAQFIGVLLGLDTVSRIDYLFMSTATIDGHEQPSDVANIVADLGSAIPVWGALLALVSLLALYLGLRSAWRAPRAT